MRSAIFVRWAKRDIGHFIICHGGISNLLPGNIKEKYPTEISKKKYQTEMCKRNIREKNPIKLSKKNINKQEGCSPVSRSRFLSLWLYQSASKVVLSSYKTRKYECWTIKPFWAHWNRTKKKKSPLKIIITVAGVKFCGIRSLPEGTSWLTSTHLGCRV